MSGIGDHILATGQAREIFKQTGSPVSFSEWSPVFENNPYISENGIPIPNCKGSRPYCYNGKDRFIFNPNFKIIKGDIFFTEKEHTDKGKDLIIINPSTKGGWRKNKAWPYWKQLAKAIDCYQFDIGERVTKTIHTSSLRESLAVLENARLLITTEGGLHHAAAALGVPCITIFTGFTHPAQLGYDDQTNLRADFSPPCGSLSICNHCAEMSAKVSVEEVYEESQRYLVAR